MAYSTELKITDNISDKKTLMLIGSASAAKQVFATKHKLAFKIESLEASGFVAACQGRNFVESAILYGLTQWIVEMWSGKTTNCPVPKHVGLFGHNVTKHLKENQAKIVQAAIDHKKAVADQKAADQAAKNAAAAQNGSVEVLNPEDFDADLPPMPNPVSDLLAAFKGLGKADRNAFLNEIALVLESERENRTSGAEEAA